MYMRLVADDRRQTRLNIYSRRVCVVGQKKFSSKNMFESADLPERSRLREGRSFQVIDFVIKLFLSDNLACQLFCFNCAFLQHGININTNIYKAHMVKEKALNQGRGKR
jgi:hypothetical protein